MMRFTALVVAAVMALGLGLVSAQAEKRVALVIGNSSYEKVGVLPNPGRDAAAIGELFRQAGFDRVDVRINLNQADLRKALRDFSRAVKDADIAVVFYAGHGIEMNGVNFLIPIDARLERDIDVGDETVPLERVSEIIEPARRLRLILLDACRDNPFASRMERSGSSRSIGRGFARFDVAGGNTLVAFAAKPGTTAADGDGANSPYTSALLHVLATPGLEIRMAMGRVRDEVLAKTEQRQEPTIFGSLGGTEIVLVPGKPTSPPPVAAPSVSIDSNSGYVVSVSTQDSEAAVRESFRMAQTRYPEVLGSEKLLITPVTRPGGNVRYRATVARLTRKEAIELCESLKSAGGQCFVAPAKQDPASPAMDAWSLPKDTTAPVIAPPAAAPSVSIDSNPGYVVSVSTQDSEAAARESFQMAQTRYPEVLGSEKLLITPVTWPDGQVKYRATVARQTRKEAVELCERLRSAGGQCFVAPAKPDPASPARDAWSLTKEPTARDAWRLTKDTKDLAILEEFIGKYGDSDYASLARERIAELKKAPAGGLSRSDGRFEDTAVLPRAVLLLEDSKPRKISGTVTWEFEPGNNPSDGRVRAVVDFPERELKLRLTFQRNSEPSLPASHTAELSFVTPDSSGGGIEAVGMFVMKTSADELDEVALAGSVVNVIGGLFLVGLSESMRGSNIELLKKRAWFAIPVTFDDKKRALISLEKGPSGERVFTEAFAKWGD